jgi:hypothetical protein
MLDVLAYLKANGFKTYIVSSGGIEFMRFRTEYFYSIPQEQVVGSSIETKFEMRSAAEQNALQSGASPGHSFFDQILRTTIIKSLKYPLCEVQIPDYYLVVAGP